MFENFLKTELDKLASDFISKYDEKGMRASGRWADSVEVVVQENKGFILANDYSKYLEQGRKPGYSPYEAIEAWVKDKGLESKIEGSIRSFVFAIINKHKREGWNREGFGGINLISDVFNETRVDSIFKNLKDQASVEFASDISGLFKKILSD